MAWTITPTIDDRVSIKTAMGEKLIVVKLACVSDGTAEEYTFTPSLIREIRGSWLYLVKFVPGTVGASFAFDVWDKNSDKILDTTGNSNTATSFVLGSDTLGVFPPVIHDLTLELDGASATTATNTLDIYMYFTK